MIEQVTAIDQRRTRSRASEPRPGGRTRPRSSLRVTHDAHHQAITGRHA